MAIGMVWHDVDPPNSSKEVSEAIFLVTLARNVGLREITLQNRGEWIWRWAFLRSIGGGWCDTWGHRKAGAFGPDAPFADLLDRFRGVTFQDPDSDCSRGEFIDEVVEEVIDAAQGLAAITAEGNLEFTVTD